MLTNRYLLVISIVSLLLVSLVASQPRSEISPSVDLGWPSRPVIEPVTRSLDVYYHSERTLLDPNAGLAIYHQSERTLVDQPGDRGHGRGADR